MAATGPAVASTYLLCPRVCPCQSENIRRSGLLPLDYFEVVLDREIGQVLAHRVGSLRPAHPTTVGRFGA